jgi:hypothetical protein
MLPAAGDTPDEPIIIPSSQPQEEEYNLGHIRAGCGDPRCRLEMCEHGDSRRMYIYPPWPRIGQVSTSHWLGKKLITYYVDARAKEC